MNYETIEWSVMQTYDVLSEGKSNPFTVVSRVNFTSVNGGVHVPRIGIPGAVLQRLPQLVKLAVVS